jgi:S-(hydroxymethyl)glutathione dehydrogenase / alcohol dehydrogenase
MRAAVLWPAASELSVETVSVDAPQASEVLVRTAAAGICGSDLKVLSGLMAATPPVILGHEASGVVEALGSDVRGLRKGDHVVLCQSSSCGRCEDCLKGRPTLCRTVGLRSRSDGTPRIVGPSSAISAASGIGAFAEYMLVHERSVLVVPEWVDLRVAAILGCAVVTGMGAVLRTARIELGATAAVIGAGAVGLCCVQAARLAGASRIIAVDDKPWRLEAASGCGATDLIDPAETDVVDAVKDLTGGGVEYSFEAVGSARTVEQAFAMLRNGGTCTVIGIVPDATPISLRASALLAERRLQGSANGSNRFHLDVPRYLELYQQGRLVLDGLLGPEVRLESISEGMDLAARGRYARTIVTFADDGRSQPVGGR